jgi:hypothetical protein
VNATTTARKDGRTSRSGGSRSEAEATAHDCAVEIIIDSFDACVVAERWQKARNWCGASLLGMRSHAVYCSSSCRREACRKRAADREAAMQ